MKSVVLTSLWSIALFLFGCCQIQEFRDIVERPSPKSTNVMFYKLRNKKCPEDSNWNLKPFQPFRFKAFAFPMPGITSQGFHLIKDLLREIEVDFQNMFLVRRSVQTLGLPEDSAHECNNANDALTRIGWNQHFSSHIVRFFGACEQFNETEGIPDADFAVYVRSWNCSSGILASAIHCGPASFDGRPKFGKLTLCPDTLSVENWNRHSLKRTLQHEIMHTMGFSIYSGISNAVLSYKRNGVFVSGLVTTTRKWKVNAGYTRYLETSLITTPIITSFVRDHFNCSTLEGAELENEGGDGTHQTHWEKRIFGVETMCGYLSRRSYLSGLTLAFFEDLRWYKTNYFPTDPLMFGKNKGCIFAQASCREYMDSLGPKNLQPRAARPYCNWADLIENKKLKSNIRECSPDREYYMRCDFQEVKNTKDIDQEKTYFADQWAEVDGEMITGHNIYGYATTLDGCPYWTEERRSGKGKVADSVCTNIYGQPRPDGNWGAEIFSNESMCFKQDGKFEVFECMSFGLSMRYTETGTHGAGCYKYKCDHGRLMVQANYSMDDQDSQYLYMRTYKVCWGKGSVIYIRRHQFTGAGGDRRFHKGVIICPSCKDICENNPRFPGFKCLPDIQLNSSDYAPVPCQHANVELNNSSIVIQSGMKRTYLLMTLVALLVIFQCVFDF